MSAAFGTRIFVKPLQIPRRSDLLKRKWTIHSNSVVLRQLATSRIHEKGATSITRTQPEGIRVEQTRSNSPKPDCRIRTLDPTRLTPDDFFDISSQTSVTLNVTLQGPEPGGDAAVQATPDSIARFWAPYRARGGCFPPNTHGYFYYHVPPHCPPIGGELRFRITPSQEPATGSFAAGSDMLNHRGLRWTLPLYKMAYRDSFQRVFALLLQDGLVSQQTLDLAKSAAEKLRLDPNSGGERPTGGQAGTPVVWAFGQEFEMRLGGGRRLCVFVGTDSVFRKQLSHLFEFAMLEKGRAHRYTLFEGSIVCWFERSTLPQHAGKRVVVLRVKQLVDSDPVRPITIPGGDLDSMEKLRPREGELLKTMRHREIRLWAVDVDKPTKVDMATGTMLRTLFENEKVHGSFQNPEIYSET
ncbi:hypothetical protein LXA43DRAFT_701677 [Ganoderma leucocontextum]|nr:hypothetical protein LXA43DRAFT_701677 [Ganoderma leucocontextum]